MQHGLWTVIIRSSPGYLSQMQVAPEAMAVLRSVAANVRRLRTRLQITQEQLAELAGLDLRFLQRIEAGRTNLGIVVLASLSQALGTSPSALLRKAELKPPPRGRPKKAAGRRTPK